MCVVRRVRSAIRDGVVVEIGVVPQRRHEGIGTGLLSTVLHYFARRGATSVEALLDDTNVPSLRLHTALGFKVEAGPYCTWRRAV